MNTRVLTITALLAASVLAAPEVPTPPNTVLPLPVTALEIRGFELAIPGVSARTNNLIRLGFSRNVRVETNDVVMVLNLDSSVDVLVDPSEILAAQTNYATVASMPIEYITPIMYQIGVTKATSALQATGYALMQPEETP